MPQIRVHFARQRVHFVYRVYDRHGLPLYIGCTMSPTLRWYQHRNSLAAWVPYAHTFKMQGPYTREVALRIESDLIATELPYFNAARPGRRYRRGQCPGLYDAALADLAERSAS